MLTQLVKLARAYAQVSRLAPLGDRSVATPRRRKVYYVVVKPIPQLGRRTLEVTLYRAESIPRQKEALAGAIDEEISQPPTRQHTAVALLRRNV